MSREQRGACQFSTAARWRLGMCDVSCHRVWLGLFPIHNRDYVFFLLCDSLDSLIPCFGDEECKISILFSYVETNVQYSWSPCYICTWRQLFPLTDMHLMKQERSEKKEMKRKWSLAVTSS